MRWNDRDTSTRWVSGRDDFVARLTAHGLPLLLNMSLRTAQSRYFFHNFTTPV